MPAIHEVEVRIRINATTCYGMATCRNGTWTYKGDVEQCDDCGQDAFTVATEGDTFTDGHLSGFLFLRCDHCGNTYKMIED